MDFFARKPEGAPAQVTVGTMNFGKRTPEAESVRIVHRALERGLHVFDTANVYNEGESERILGRALKGRRDQAFVATKVGFGKLVGPREGLSPARIAAAIDESLGRLQMDYVDLYYLHVPDPSTPIEETVTAMEKLVDAGKVRAWGVSNYASWQIAEICLRARIRPRISQVMYNLLVRQLDLEYFAFARKFGIHNTIFNPLAGGLLAGKGLDRVIEKGSRFDGNAMYQKRYLSDRFFDLVRAYQKLAQEAGLSSVQLAYAFVSQRPGVDSVLLGPASVEQLDAGIDGCALRLPAELVARVDEMHHAFQGTDVSYAR